MIDDPEKVATVMTALGESVIMVLAQSGASEIVTDVVRETIDRFNLMYAALYEIASRPTDWNGYSAKARETLEKVTRS